MADVKCPKCGAAIKVDPGVHFKKCDYCESMVFIDRSGVMFYYVLPFFLDQQKALETFKRWTAGSLMAKDLETAARVMEVRKEYFPVYMFKRDVNGQEQVHIRPAKGTVLPGMYNLKIPAGDIKIFDKDFNPGDAKVLDVDIPMDQYFPQLPGQPKEQALVYFPIFVITYDYKGQMYTAVVDGSTGAVYASNYPKRNATAYGLVAGTSFLLGLLGSAGVFLINWACITLILMGLIVGLGAGYYVAKNM